MGHVEGERVVHGTMSKVLKVHTRELSMLKLERARKRRKVIRLSYLSKVSARVSSMSEGC
jgi:hypothetical protein